MNTGNQKRGNMRQEKNGKKAWMGVLSEYYGEEGKGKNQKTMEKWRDLHYYGRLEIVDRMINIQDGNVLLDIGCGSGERLARFENKCTLTMGVDISDLFCYTSKEGVKFLGVLS